MSNLQNFNIDGLELVIDSTTGVTKASQSAIARMSGVSQVAISKRLTHNQVESEKAEVLTTTGLKTHNLYSEEVILETIQYYANKGSIEAQKNLNGFLRLGMRVYLHNLAGFRVISEAIQTEQSQNVPYLAPEDKALKVALSIRQITDSLDDNPRLAQALIDHAMNDIFKAKAISAGSDPQLKAATEIAEELGYETKDLSIRTRLGRFVAQSVEPVGKELRYCNGMQRPINVYQDTVELRALVREFYD